jgi:PIN domain nuclease of toxin-antitoxin system
MWAANRPEKLSGRVRRALLKTTNELYLSPVSIWEAYHLERKSGFRDFPRFSHWLDRVLIEMLVKEAPFNFQVAVKSSQITLPQPDFGDILLAATASVFDLTLVTADSQLIECSWVKTLANQ